MLVMSQDRDAVVDTTGKCFWVGGRIKNRFEILCNNFLTDEIMKLATYSTRSKAEAELFKMFKSFEDEKCRTYMFTADRKVVTDGACG